MTEHRVHGSGAAIARGEPQTLIVIFEAAQNAWRNGVVFES